MEFKARMASPFHAQVNGAAERTNQTMKQVLRTVVLAKQQEPNVGMWLRLLDIGLDMVDLHSGFHQIRVFPEHVERTAFRTQHGTFAYQIPLGLCNDF